MSQRKLTCQDQISFFKSHDRRDMSNQSWNTKDHIFSISILFDLFVDLKRCVGTKRKKEAFVQKVFEIVESSMRRFRGNPDSYLDTNLQP